ncbi:peptidoglycan-binding domain-containing protein [Actinocorallia populi]|uniref:peptidoglycan-binding domain-containing protein n=1 Tax=Actinocorallia populi TaxID=2079200 RepID=UPI001300A3A6|nr:peptidoglycan-binding domain-containing protein [Actinocorallia populi]
MAVISGRPVIALRGSVPAYRDLKNGYKGADVEQLQQGLREAGYSVADSTGVYGASTQAAVKQLFIDKDFEPALEAADALESPNGPHTTGTRKPIGPRKVVVLRSSEVVFVPEFPARVLEVKATLGSEVKGTLLRLATGELVVTGSLQPSDRRLVKAGSQAKIASPASGTPIKASVRSIGPYSVPEPTSPEGSEEQTEPQQEPGHPITVRSLKPLSTRLTGQEVQVSIDGTPTDGPVLVVPASAIYAAADGSTQVIKMAPDGRQTRVTVTTGATGTGYVEISGTGLAEGDQVVVGAK